MIDINKYRPYGSEDFGKGRKSSENGESRGTEGQGAEKRGAYDALREDSL